MVRQFLLFAVMLSSVGCSSWLIRQSCKDIDWFQYGHSVAMSGRRLSGDPQVQRCQKAEFEVPYRQLDSGFKAGMEKYCQPKVVYAIGKTGDLFNPELCDPGQVRMLKQEHEKGLKAYCSVENGFTAGSSGKVYQNVCPMEAEGPFLKEYRRGRRSYITGKITEADTNLLALDRQMLELERERSNLGWRLNAIPPAHRAPKPEDDPYRFERDQIKSSLDRLEGQIRSKISEKERLIKDKGAFQAELATLQET